MAGKRINALNVAYTRDKLSFGRWLKALFFNSERREALYYHNVNGEFVPYRARQHPLLRYWYTDELLVRRELLISDAIKRAKKALKALEERKKAAIVERDEEIRLLGAALNDTVVDKDGEVQSANQLFRKTFGKGDKPKSEGSKLLFEETPAVDTRRHNNNNKKGGQQNS